MTHEDFWTTVQAMENAQLQERLDFIRTTEYDIPEVEAQPWAITQMFSDLAESDTPIEDAFQVAEVFKERFGLLIIEREASFCDNRYMTIMDHFDSSFREYNNAFWIGMLRYAFKRTGFLYAKDIDPKVAYRIYANKWYFTFDDVDFKDLFQQNPFAEELAQYVFHPTRVAKWLEANPEKGADEYMN